DRSCWSGRTRSLPHGRRDRAARSAPPARSRHYPARNTAARPADWRRASRRAHAHAHRNREGEYSCGWIAGAVACRDVAWHDRTARDSDPMSDAPRLNIVELTVSELSATLKRTLEDAYGYVRVRGELGKVSYHSNGHVYFDLKDDRACIAGVVWRSAAQRIKLKLEAGLEVVATGRITTYPGRSQYQLIVETLEPAGLGALMALLEERKKKL